jgi:four helix bundle protein
LKKAHNFRELIIWKESMSLVKKIYVLTSQLPNNERFGLVSQINRSCISIPSNIAEGSGRTTEKEFSRFLEIAMSSSYELETQLILISELYEINIEDVLMDLKSIQFKIGAFKRTLS